METSRSLKISHLEEGTRRESTDLGNICKNNCDESSQGDFPERMGGELKAASKLGLNKKFGLRFKIKTSQSFPDRINRHLFLCLY